MHQIIEAVIETRDTNHDSGLEHGQILSELQDISLIKAYFHSDCHASEKHQSFEDVSKRKIGDINILVMITILIVKKVKACNVDNKISVS